MLRALSGSALGLCGAECSCFKLIFRLPHPQEGVGVGEVPGLLTSQPLEAAILEPTGQEGKRPGHQ